MTCPFFPPFSQCASPFQVFSTSTTIVFDSVPPICTFFFPLVSGFPPFSYVVGPVETASPFDFLGPEIPLIFFAISLSPHGVGYLLLRLFSSARPGTFAARLLYSSLCIVYPPSLSSPPPPYTFLFVKSPFSLTPPRLDVFFYQIEIFSSRAPSRSSSRVRDSPHSSSYSLTSYFLME